MAPLQKVPIGLAIPLPTRSKPDPWIGSVVLVEPDRVQPLDVDFGETSAICERLGRDSGELLASVRADRPPAAEAD